MHSETYIRFEVRFTVQGLFVVVSTTNPHFGSFYLLLKKKSTKRVFDITDKK